MYMLRFKRWVLNILFLKEFTEVCMSDFYVGTFNTVVSILKEIGSQFKDA